MTSVPRNSLTPTVATSKPTTLQPPTPPPTATVTVTTNATTSKQTTAPAPDNATAVSPTASLTTLSTVTAASPTVITININITQIEARLPQGSTLTAILTTTSTLTTTSGSVWSVLGLTEYNTLLFLVLGGCTLLFFLVLAIICCRLLCLRPGHGRESQGDSLKAEAARTSSYNLYADPHRVIPENHYQSNDVTRLYATPEVTYAKPEVYSTFINPSFYEDVYARWKRQEQTKGTYDPPVQYSRRLKEQLALNPDLRWSKDSLHAVDAYDYNKYGRIPRGKMTLDDRDGNAVATETTSAFTTF